MDETFFQIDPEFKRLLPELSTSELNQLESSLLREGCQEPIVVWENIIVEGHDRYDICKRNKLDFKVIQMNFSCRDEAIRWICLNQRGRMNLSQELLRYQIGKRYTVERKLVMHTPVVKNQHSKATSDIISQSPKEERMGTCASIGKEYNLSHNAVHSYKELAATIDAIAEKDSRLVAMYLSGQMRIKKDDLTAISRMTKWQIRALTNNLIRQNKNVCRTQDVLKALSERDPQRKSETAKERRQAQAIASLPSVKDMPVYNPDNEVASLSLTIPSWRSSIDRVFKKTNMQLLSDEAKTQLWVELMVLRENIDLIILAIEEVSQNG